MLQEKFVRILVALGDFRTAVKQYRQSIKKFPDPDSFDRQIIPKDIVEMFAKTVSQP